MGNRIHALAQQLTGKATIEECSIDEVKHIVKRFPYFAPAQFLLLQKLRQIASPEAEAQYKKAVLFYHDPLLFDYFISSDKFYVAEESLFEKKEADAFVTETEQQTSGYTTLNEDEVVAENLNEVNESDEEIHQTKGEELKKEVDVFITEPEKQTSDYATLNEDAVIPENLNEEKENNQEIYQTTEEKLNKEVDASALTEQTTETASVYNETHSEESFADAEQVMTEMSNDEGVETNQEVPSSPKFSFPEWNKETKQPDNETSELTFEPYHTVDYFASQGIKISQEELPKDKLGKQLKSFTQWLKTMKRLPTMQMSNTVETSAEKKVETMAGQSVTESQVVTEAMAEVWARQGNLEKAMETYNKLSLLNPSKTAYFAAKIENLKQS